MREVTSKMQQVKARMLAVSRRSPLLIACCSATKRLAPAVRASDIVGSDGFLADMWLAAVGKVSTRVRADDLYTGRAFRMLKAAAEAHAIDLGIISAGLGFILGGTAVPSYSLTLMDGPDALRRCASALNVEAWWASVSLSPFASDIQAEVRSRPVTLLALTQPYARMLAATLDALSDDLARIRLVGLGLDRVLPASVTPSILPYDQRVEALLPGGTLGEFAARAMAFHLGNWSGREWDLEREREHATKLCRDGVARCMPVRRRATDEEILAAISKDGEPSSPAAALRRLRDNGVACGSERIGRIMTMAEGLA